MSNIGIAGVGAYAPSLVVTNDDISRIVETSDEWISRRTGIKERRISEGEDTSDLAYNAGKLALERADLDPKDLDLIIVATISPDMFLPSVACKLQERFGADNAACFDISVACSGFVYALETAKGLMNSMDYNNALVIGAENLSKIIDWEDRATCILFGDGAGAAVLKRTENGSEVMKSYLRAEGKKGNALTVGAASLNTPFVKEKQIKKQTVEMDGKEVFRFAVSAISNGIKEALKRNNLTIDDVKYIIPHQANVRIIQSAAKLTHINPEKFYVNLDKYGNTSSASVPIALNQMFEEGLLNKGDKIILVAFGGGLTYASTVIKW